jgi:hypothetical protein
VLVRGLDALGDQTWVDSALRGGQRWWDEILRRIDNCDVFVAIGSSHTIEFGGVYTGTGMALALNKPVLPLAVERLPDALSPTRSMRQIVNYSQSGGGRIRAGRCTGDPSSGSTTARAFARTPVVPFGSVEQAGQPEPLMHEQQRQILIQLRPALRAAESEAHRGASTCSTCSAGGPVCRC